MNPLPQAHPVVRVIEDGVMPMTRRLGEHVRTAWQNEGEQIPELKPIDMPRRPYLGLYSKEAQAEMLEIWAREPLAPLPPAGEAQSEKGTRDGA